MTLPCGHSKNYYYFHPALRGGMRHRCAACDNPKEHSRFMQELKKKEQEMAKDFGRQYRKHVFIDLDSWNHSEVWLHVFRKILHHPDEEDKLIVVEEGGFADGAKMKVMTREEFKQEYEIDVPELF